MKSFCTNCNCPTNQNILHETKIDFHEEEGSWWDVTRYQVIQCAGCDEITFRKLYTDVSMQIGVDEYKSDEVLFPRRGIHVRPLKTFHGLPASVLAIYRETIDAYNTNLTLLCSVGVRAIVESICLDKGITSGKVKNAVGNERVSKKLDGKISGLLANGYITGDAAETLHELRFLGNEAVHELSRPSIEELGIAIDVIELSIENIYMIKRKTKHLQERRANRKETVSK